MEAFDPGIPALVPPAGRSSHFDDPQDTLRALKIGGSTAIIIVTSAMVTIRAITSTKLIKRWYADDYASVTAFLLLLGVIGITMHEPFSTRISSHMWDVRLIDIPAILYNVGNVQILLTTSLLMAKLAILLQLRRLFCTGARDALTYCVDIFTVLYTLFSIISIFIFIFRCNPRDKAWNILKDGTCINQFDLVVATGVASAISDYITLAFPVWVVSRMNLSIRRKLGAIAVFGVGIFACVLGTIGIPIRVSLYHTADLTYSLCKMGSYVAAESSLVICVGCTPAIPRLYRLLKGQDEKPQEIKKAEGKNPDLVAKNPADKCKSNLVNSMAKYMSGGGQSLFTDKDDIEALRVSEIGSVSSGGILSIDTIAMDSVV